MYYLHSIRLRHVLVYAYSTNTPDVFMFLLHFVCIWRYSQVVSGRGDGGKATLHVLYMFYLVKSSPLSRLPFSFFSLTFSGSSFIFVSLFILRINLHSIPL